LSFCITQLGTTRHTDTNGGTQLDTHYWTHRFGGTFRRIHLWKSDRSMTKTVTYTSHNIRKTHNINIT